MDMTGTKVFAAIRFVLGLAIAVFVVLPLLFAPLGFAVDAYHHNLPKSDPTMVPTIVGYFVVLPLTILLARWLIRSGWRVLQPPADANAIARDARGFWERLGDAHPRWFGRVWSLNGMGLRYLDYRDKRESDGSYIATVWLVFGFLPIGPIRSERVRIGGETTRGLPLVATATSEEIVPLERVAIERPSRVYAFYYALFLPLTVGPVFAALALVISLPTVSARDFWLGALAVLVWGIGMVAVERQIMGRPRA